MPRHSLSDEQWALIEPLLPPEKPAIGRPAISHRRFLNAIIWLVRTGAPWRDLPTEYGPWRTMATRFYRWRRNGTLFKMFKALQGQAEARGLLDWELHCLDSTVIRAHQHAAGGKRGALRALGRSRGGFGTKIHLRTDRKGNPIVFTLTGGEKHDAPQSVKPVDTGAVNGTRPGRPRLRPARIAGDKGYDSAALRMALRQRHIEPIIPSRCNRRRQIAFDKIRYRERNVIERCINKLKQWRRVATRYEKLAANYAAVILIAVSMRFLNILL